MIVCRTKEELSNEVLNAKKQSKTIGFVPTMGALHKGHLTLVQNSVEENDITIVSIFVNPRQFNQTEDFEKYPRNHQDDANLLDEVKCDVVFIPIYNEVFNDESKLNVDLKGLENILEGEHRPGHFQGVVDVVHRLFVLVKPNRAYFGTKDYQQLMIINAMVKYCNVDVQIVECPIVREVDGMAMSSRNKRLSKIERENAVVISKAIFEANNLNENSTISYLKKFVWDKLNVNKYLTPEYVEICEQKTLKLCTADDCVDNKILLVAVWCGKVRLIDNILLNSK